ncbi:MAG: hypothetical protein INR73_09285 [Williamsia sp.]|nr:hypothetical protein [Williamsia sp.]
MKWIKFKKPPTPDSPDDRESYDFYDDQKEVDKKLKIDRTGIPPDEPNPDPKQKHLWIAYQFNKFIQPKQQRDYEIFCGGFLVYHENIIKLNKVKYQLYFDWSKRKDKLPFSVSIYITPAPVKEERKYLQPEKPATGTKKAGTAEAHKAVADADVAGLQDDAISSRFVSVDPPPPPPPPPPSRE